MEDESVLAKGLVECIGEGSGARLVYQSGDSNIDCAVDVPDHGVALEKMVSQLIDSDHGAIRSIDEINAVGHRVVHGGEAFVDAAKITDEVIGIVEEQAPLAPLHNPPNLTGIRAARKVFSAVPHVAVFDTAFHQTLPPHAFHYGVPYELYEKHHVRRYGFHGTSHLFVARRAAKHLGKPFSEFNGITCHLGNGCSMAAIRNGKSVDTTMGLTPLEGLLMGTRSGDIDPALPFFLTRTLGIPFEEVDSLLNKKSGLLGVSGVSNDMRTLIEAARDGSDRAQLAIEMFAYRVKKYIGAYTAVLNGCDAVVFTGGIGERSALQRSMICSNLDNIGILLDENRNAQTEAVEATISAAGSHIAVLVIPTNEELEIARETAALTRGNEKQPVLCVETQA